jgi:hypothetical protein
VAHNHGASADAQGNHNHDIRSGDNVGIRSYPASYNIITGISNAETLAYTNAGSDQPFIGNAGTHSHNITVNSAGTSGTNANLPPYYALCFIMKPFPACGTIKQFRSPVSAWGGVTTRERGKNGSLQQELIDAGQWF